MKPGPQSETFHAGRYGLTERPGHYALVVKDGVSDWQKLEVITPTRVPEWLVGLGVVLLLVSAIGAAVALACIRR